MATPANAAANGRTWCERAIFGPLRESPARAMALARALRFSRPSAAVVEAGGRNGHNPAAGRCVAGNRARTMTTHLRTLFMVTAAAALAAVPALGQDESLEQSFDRVLPEKVLEED